MKKVSHRLFLVVGLLCALTVGMAVNAEAATRGSSSMSNLDQPSLFNVGDKSIGIGYLGAWAGGIDFTGSYWFTRNIALQADLALLSYTFPAFGGFAATTVSFTYVDVMGVYHMAFSDSIGAYGGLGFAIGTATATGFTNFTVGGLAWEAGAEMFFTQNIRGHVGVLSGGINAGVDWHF